MNAEATTLRLKFSNPYFVNVMTRTESFPAEVAKVLTETGTEKFTRIGVAIAKVLFDDIVEAGWTNSTPYRHAARATGRTFSTIFGFELPEDGPKVKAEKSEKVAKVAKVKEPKVKKSDEEVKTNVDQVLEVVGQVLSDAVDSVFESESESILEVEEAGPAKELVAEAIAQEHFDEAVIGSEQKTNITHETNEELDCVMTYRGTRADGSKVPYRAKFADGTIEFYDAAGRLHDPYSGRAAVTHPDKTTEHYKHGVLTTINNIMMTGSITTRDREG